MSSDVRSLLRSELASRRITHPYATYSSTGILICSLCKQQIKSQSLWDTHLRSTAHVARVAASEIGQTVSGPRESPSGGGASDSKRKRKIVEEESREPVDEGGRKRARGDEDVVDKRPRKKIGGLPQGFFDEKVNEVEGDEDDNDDEGKNAPEQVKADGEGEAGGEGPTDESRQNEEVEKTTPANEEQEQSILSSTLPSDFFDNPPNNPPEPSTNEQQRKNQVDEAEWAAFEQEIALTAVNDDRGRSDTKISNQTISTTQTQSVLKAPSNISAPALSAAEIASLARQAAATGNDEGNDDENARRRKREEAEREALEQEEEEAKRRLEEEFDAMDSFEARLARLKEKREALRRRAELNSLGDDGGGDDDEIGEGRGGVDGAKEVVGEGDANEKVVKEGSTLAVAVAATHLNNVGDDDDDDDESESEDGSELDDRWSRWE